MPFPGTGGAARARSVSGASIGVENPLAGLYGAGVMEELMEGVMVGNAVGAAKGLAAAKLKNKRPASGMPASGTPAAGNDGGRPPEPYDGTTFPTAEERAAGYQANMTALELCKPHRAKAIKAWVANLDSENGQVSNAAAAHIIERTDGKAIERVMQIPPPVPVPIDLSQLTEAQLDALQEVLLMTERPEQKKIEGKETE